MNHRNTGLPSSCPPSASSAPPCAVTLASAELSSEIGSFRARVPLPAIVGLQDPFGSSPAVPAGLSDPLPDDDPPCLVRGADLESPGGEFDILVVDDEAEVRAVLHEVIAALGYSVRFARNGAHAIGLLDTHRFRLVITDIFMPEMDGLEFLMRYLALQPNARVLAMSGGGGLGRPDAILRPAQHLGCCRALAKPFALGDLVGTIQELLAD